MTNHTIGVDISKDHLDAFLLPDDTAQRFTNDRAGFRSLLKWIARRPVDRVVYEPTGAYHRAFEEALSQSGLPLAKVNPLQARRFAQACGTRAKTDRVDARMLAHMGKALRPAITVMPSRLMRDFKQLQIARQALVKDRTAARNRSKHLTVLILKRQNTKRLRQIECDLETIEEAMKTLIKQDEAWSRRFRILCSIPGISAITAMTLLAEIPELGTLDGKQVASLAGLAPYSRDSGKWKGKRFIGGGRKFLRDALYMPALAACRFNADLAKHTNASNRPEGPQKWPSLQSCES